MPLGHWDVPLKGIVGHQPLPFVSFAFGHEMSFAPSHAPTVICCVAQSNVANQS